MAKVLILSDTHRDIRLIEKVLKKEGDYDVLVHIGDHHTDLEEANISGKKPILKVRGNCDFEPEEDELFAEIGAVKLFITHGHYYNVKNYLTKLEYRAEELGADIALFGHTHIKKCYVTDNGIYIFNPGSLSSYRSYGKPSYGVAELDRGVIKYIEHREL